MNVGVAEARNDLVVRADAHTQYGPTTCGGRSTPSCAGSRLGRRPDGAGGRERLRSGRSGGDLVPVRCRARPFHYATEATDVETVYLGTFDRSIVFEVGGYDEIDLQWAAEDQELAFRLRRAGRRIHLDPAIRSWYVPRDTVTALWRQYFNYGMCKASTLNKHRTLPYWRPLVPAAMVAGPATWMLVFGAKGRWVIALAPVAGYAAGAGAVSMRIGDQPGVAPHRALPRAHDLPLGLRLRLLAGDGTDRLGSSLRQSTEGVIGEPGPVAARMREYAVKGVHAGLRELGRAPDQQRARSLAPSECRCVPAGRRVCWSSARDRGPPTSTGKR